MFARYRKRRFSLFRDVRCEERMDFFFTNIIGNEEEINFQRISMNSSSEIDHFFSKSHFDVEGEENASRIDCWSLGRDHREITRLTITDRPRFLLSICTADSDSVPREYANEKSLARGKFLSVRSRPLSRGGDAREELGGGNVETRPSFDRRCFHLGETRRIPRETEFLLKRNFPLPILPYLTELDLLDREINKPRKESNHSRIRLVFHDR